MSSGHLLIRIGKAHGQTDVRNVVIQIGPDPVEILENPARSRAAFRRDAERLAFGLVEALPEATLDQLTAMLLERKASMVVSRS